MRKASAAVYAGFHTCCSHLEYRERKKVPLSLVAADNRAQFYCEFCDRQQDLQQKLLSVPREKKSCPAPTSWIRPKQSKILRQLSSNVDLHALSQFGSNCNCMASTQLFMSPTTAALNLRGPLSDLNHPQALTLGTRLDLFSSFTP